MNDLHKAYHVLGLEPGASMEAITRRYKRLIMVWHPDRAHSPEAREFAEEELKKINNAKDLFTKHFGRSGDHRMSGCRCQPDQSEAKASSGSGPHTGPGPGYHRAKSAEEKQREEEAARKRDADRRRREQEEADTKRAQDEAKRNQGAAASGGMEAAMQQQKSLQDERLRWRISAGIIIAFMALEIFGAVVIGAKSWWHDVTWKWQHDHPSKKDDSITTSTDSATTKTSPEPLSDPTAKILVDKIMAAESGKDGFQPDSLKIRDGVVFYKDKPVSPSDDFDTLPGYQTEDEKTYAAKVLTDRQEIADLQNQIKHNKDLLQEYSDKADAFGKIITDSRDAADKSINAIYAHYPPDLDALYALRPSVQAACDAAHRAEEDRKQTIRDYDGLIEVTSNLQSRLFKLTGTPPATQLERYYNLQVTQNLGWDVHELDKDLERVTPPRGVREPPFQRQY